MTGRANLTKTRSGRPRVNVDVAAVAQELEAVKSDVGSLKRVLAPAFSAAPSPPMRVPMGSSRGPGDYPVEPFTMRQASSNADPWADDYEHSAQFMADAMRGGNIAELRARSAQDRVMRATRQPPPVIWESPQSCGRGGCRPATPCANCAGRSNLVRDDGAHLEPPRQASIVHRQWEDFPDHKPPPGAEPGWSVARQQAAAMPTRQPETGGVWKGP